MSRATLADWLEKRVDGIRFAASRDSKGWACMFPDAEFYETTAAIVAALRASEPPEGERIEGWRPIESAPKDGTKVLLYCPMAGPTGGRWNTDEFAKKPRPYWRTDLERLWGTSRTREDQPTHWQPLPASPAQPFASSEPTPEEPLT